MWRLWGLQGGCNECTAVKKNSVSLPGRERKRKVVKGEMEMWEEMLRNRMCCVDGAEFSAARQTLLPFGYACVCGVGVHRECEKEGM